LTERLLREPFRLPFAFFTSGAAALLFQVLWFRALGRVLGNTVWAGALVLTAFMLGMAIGGLLVARWTQRIRNPARAFALAETTVALTGILPVWGLPLLEPVVGQWLAPLAGHPAAMAGVRLALALAAMLVPTIAMGTTLALGVRVLAHKETTRALGVLYAANTFGACFAPLDNVSDGSVGNPPLGRFTGFLPIVATSDTGLGNPILGGGGPRSIQLAVKLIF